MSFSGIVDLGHGVDCERYAQLAGSEFGSLAQGYNMELHYAEFVPCFHDETRAIQVFVRRKVNTCETRVARVPYGMCVDW